MLYQIYGHLRQTKDRIATSTIVAATRIYSQNKQAEVEAQKQAAEQQALEKLKAEGGADWAEYKTAQMIM